MAGIGLSFAQSTVWSDLWEIDVLKFLSYLQQVVFFILWPFVSLAGLALSNKFVTGDAVGLWEAIFAFWASMKTFAFFVIGFMFVWGILAYMVGIGKGKTSPKDLIAKLILAVIGIPLSYWLFLLLLDLSTILTISVGALPLEIGSETNVKVPNVAPHVKITSWGVAVYYSVTTENGELSKGNIVSCVFEWWVLSEEKTKKLAQETQKAFGGVPMGEEFCLLSMNRVASLGMAGKTYEEVLSKSIGVAEAENTLSAYMANPLTPLFTSLLNMSNTLEVSATQPIWNQIFTFLFNLLISLALFIPLAVLAVVLLMRGVVLRALIAFAPFLLLAWIFGFKWGDTQGKYSISSVLWLIFLPVTVVFSISLSLIFLRALSGVDSNGQQNIFTVLGFESSNNELKYNISEGVGISLSQESDGINFKSIGDFFSLLFKTGVGIALMWIIVFAALKTTKITEGVVSSVQGFAEWYLKSLRVVPVPGMGMMSVGGIQRGFSQVTQTLPGELIQKQYSDQVEPVLDEVRARFSWGSGDKKEILKMDSSLSKAQSASEAMPILSDMLSKLITSKAADLNTYREKVALAEDTRNFWTKIKDITWKDYSKDLIEAFEDPNFVALFAQSFGKEREEFEKFFEKATGEPLSSINPEEGDKLEKLWESGVLNNIYYIPGFFPNSVIMKDDDKGVLFWDEVWSAIRSKIEDGKLEETVRALAKARDPNFDSLKETDKEKVVREVVYKLYWDQNEIAWIKKDDIVEKIIRQTGNNDQSTIPNPSGPFIT